MRAFVSAEDSATQLRKAPSSSGRKRTGSLHVRIPRALLNATSHSTSGQQAAAADFAVFALLAQLKRGRSAPVYPTQSYLVAQLSEQRSLRSVGRSIERLERRELLRRFWKKGRGGRANRMYALPDITVDYLPLPETILRLLAAGELTLEQVHAWGRFADMVRDQDWRSIRASIYADRYRVEVHSVRRHLQTLGGLGLLEVEPHNGSPLGPKVSIPEALRAEMYPLSAQRTPNMGDRVEPETPNMGGRVPRTWVAEYPEHGWPSTPNMGGRPDLEPSDVEPSDLEGRVASSSSSDGGLEPRSRTDDDEEVFDLADAALRARAEQDPERWGWFLELDAERRRENAAAIVSAILERSGEPVRNHAAYVRRSLAEDPYLRDFGPLPGERDEWRRQEQLARERRHHEEEEERERQAEQLRAEEAFRERLCEVAGDRWLTLLDHVLESAGLGRGAARGRLSTAGPAVTAGVVLTFCGRDRSPASREDLTDAQLLTAVDGLLTMPNEAVRGLMASA